MELSNESDDEWSLTYPSRLPRASWPDKGPSDHWVEIWEELWDYQLQKQFEEKKEEQNWDLEPAEWWTLWGENWGIKAKFQTSNQWRET